MAAGPIGAFLGEVIEASHYDAEDFDERVRHIDAIRALGRWAAVSRDAAESICVPLQKEREQKTKARAWVLAHLRDALARCMARYADAVSAPGATGFTLLVFREEQTLLRVVDGCTKFWVMQLHRLITLIQEEGTDGSLQQKKELFSRLTHTERQGYYAAWDRWTGDGGDHPIQDELDNHWAEFVRRWYHMYRVPINP